MIPFWRRPGERLSETVREYRCAITRALDQGLSYRQMQIMSGHKNTKTVMRYDHNHENFDLNPVNHLSYDEKAEKKGGM